MIESNDIAKYLPQYLSIDTKKGLIIDLSEFPENIHQKLYGFVGKSENTVYQGDGITELPIVNLPDKTILDKPSIIISNTCDVDPENKRLFNSSLQYAPILSLKKYSKALLESGIKDVRIQGLLEAIREQKVTQIFYLPEGQGLKEEKIVFFDKMCSCNNKIIDRENLKKSRIFSLSQYGHYLFLYKLSIHFTRLGEGVDRKYN